MKHIIIALIALAFNAYAFEMTAFFSPKGGFSADNSKRKIEIDGSYRSATLNAAALKFFSKARKGSQIRIAMYSFSSGEIKRALVSAAKRGAYIKIIMDRCERGTIGTLEGLQKMFRPYSNIELAAVTSESLKRGGRTRRVYDTEGPGSKPSMHEKFGVHWYRAGGETIVDSFTGSSNFSDGSDKRYAENRILVEDDPISGKRAWEEFASLWNSKFNGKCYSRKCSRDSMPEIFEDIEDYKPSDVYGLIDEFASCARECSRERNFKSCMRGCRIDDYYEGMASFPSLTIFNSEKENGRFAGIQKALLKGLNTVDRSGGLIRIGAFKFTNSSLAKGITSFARKNSDVDVRVLLNQTEIFGSTAKTLQNGARNINVRFKWRANAFAWDGRATGIRVTHKDDFKYHHKMILVDETFLANGSYNFTSKAERKNFENESFYENFLGDKPEVQKVISSFKDEFDALWYDKDHAGDGTNVRDGMVLTYKEARSLANKISNYLDNGFRKKFSSMSSSRKRSFREKHQKTPPYHLMPQLYVRDTIKNSSGASPSSIARKTRLSKNEVRDILNTLEEFGLVFEARDGRYYIAD